MVCRTRRTTLVSRYFARLPRHRIVLFANCSAPFPQTLPHQQPRRVFGEVDVGSPCAITHDNSANENEAVRCRIKAPLVGKTCTCEKTGLRRYGILLVGVGCRHGNCSVHARSAIMDCAPVLGGCIADRDTTWTYAHIKTILHTGLSETSMLIKRSETS